MHNHHPGYLLRRLIKRLCDVIPFLIWILIIYGFDTPAIATQTLLCAALHELGHLLGALVLRRNGAVKAALCGPRIYLGGGESYYHTLIIALCGPCMNLFLAALSLPFLDCIGDGGFTFLCINILTAICNLLPLINNDGYNIIASLLNFRIHPFVTQRIMGWISFALSTVLCILSLFTMSRHDCGYWCYFISMYLLVKSLSAL